MKDREEIDKSGERRGKMKDREGIDKSGERRGKVKDREESEKRGKRGLTVWRGKECVRLRWREGGEEKS